jgi:hypothetical protein
MQKDEYILVIPALTVFAPIKLSDAEGEKLYHELESELESEMAGLKTRIEEKFPIVRIGYDIN